MHQIAQVKGSTKIIVTVVATQELEPGDVLRRFKAAQDGPNRYSRSSSVLCVGFFLLTRSCFLLVRVFAFVRWRVLFFGALDSLHKGTAWLEGSSLSELETLQY